MREARRDGEEACGSEGLSGDSGVDEGFGGRKYNSKCWLEEGVEKDGYYEKVERPSLPREGKKWVKKTVGGEGVTWMRRKK